MKIPTLSTCDLFNKEQKHQKVVVHSLKELFEDDIYVPQKPHRHAFYQILYIEKGTGIHNIDFENYYFNKDTVFFLSPGQVHNLSFLEFDTQGLIINFSDTLFAEFLANVNYIEQFHFFHKSGKESVVVLDKNPRKIRQLFTKIEKEKRIEIIRLYLLQLMYECNDLITDNLSKVSHTSSFQKVIELEELIEQNFYKEHYPKFYADKLLISPNYLNALCKKEKGKTVGNIIRERVILEAKRLLVNSKLDISQIAFSLGFEDNSYFTKFFKAQTNQTPKQFRDNL